MAVEKLGALVVIAFVCLAHLGCKRAERESRPTDSLRHNGQEWLAWSHSEQVHFVAAYIDGYEEGVQNACAAADRRLDLKANRSYDHAKNEIVLPSGVCWKGAAHYSRFKPSSAGDPDVSAYTGVITRFYIDHAEYRDIPYEYLMQYLTDEQQKTADELGNTARAGEMRTHW